VLVVVGVFILGIFSAYNKMYLPAVADGEYKRVVSVISGIERTKNQNGSVYLAVTNKAISDNSLLKLKNAMGGANSIKDVQAWTYDCAAGSGKTVTLKTTSFDSPVVAELVRDSINSNNAPWTATVGAASEVIVTKANSTCGN